MNEKECLEIGGHCWETDPIAEGKPWFGIPPQRCKHCGKSKIETYSTEIYTFSKDVKE